MNQQDKIQKRLADERKSDLEWMLLNERGRRILFRLIEDTRSFEVSFTGNSGSYFNDGRKSVGLELFHEVMGISPESFTLMWNEHMQAVAEQQSLIDDEDFKDG